MSAPEPIGPELVVRHRVPERRFEVTVDGFVAVVDYEWEGETVVFTHTFVPPELRGRRIAEQLVRAGLAWAASEQRRVVPACSYVDAFIHKNSEFQPLLRTNR